MIQNSQYKKKECFSMKIGVFSVLFYDKNFEDMLDYVAESGLI